MMIQRVATPRNSLPKFLLPPFRRKRCVQIQNRRFWKPKDHHFFIIRGRQQLIFCSNEEWTVPHFPSEASVILNTERRERSQIIILNLADQMLHHRCSKAAIAVIGV